MTRKGNIQCQAFNYNCFGLLASMPSGHMESVLSHHKANRFSLRCMLLAPGKRGAVLLRGRGAQISKHVHQCSWLSAAWALGGHLARCKCLLGPFQETREGLQLRRRGVFGKKAKLQRMMRMDGTGVWPSERDIAIILSIIRYRLQRAFHFLEHV